MKLLPAIAILALAAATLEDEDENEQLSTLIDLRSDLQEMPFPTVVESTTGHRVVPFETEKHADFLVQLAAAMDGVVNRLNDPGHPIHSANRINEASRFLEDAIREAFNSRDGWSCSIPKTTAGREQRSGYPDLRLEVAGMPVVYLDPKLYASNSRSSSLRTFYFEPKALTGKIHEDAIHLLVGVPHAGADGSSWKFLGWELVDLSKLKVRLKTEFQASNRDVYSDDTVVLKSDQSKGD